MDKKDKAEKFKDFILSLSSAIILTIMFGLITVVFIYDAFLGNIVEWKTNYIVSLNIMLTIAALIGVGYIITVLIRLQSTVSKLSEKKD
jgi:hypothetical protein